MKTTVIEKYNADGKLIEKTTITETNDSGKITWSDRGYDPDFWKDVMCNTINEPLKTFLNPNPFGNKMSEASNND